MLGGERVVLYIFIYMWEKKIGRFLGGSKILNFDIFVVFQKKIIFFSWRMKISGGSPMKWTIFRINFFSQLYDYRHFLRSRFRMR